MVVNSVLLVNYFGTNARSLAVYQHPSVLIAEPNSQGKWHEKDIKHVLSVNPALLKIGMIGM